MKTVYIDKEFMCHVDNAEGRKSITTDVFDSVCDTGIEYYRFVPKGSKWKGSKCAENFVQCINSNEAQTAQKAYEEGINATDGTIADLMDEITSLCEELIGE